MIIKYLKTCAIEIPDEDGAATIVILSTAPSAPPQADGQHGAKHLTLA
jgi:hypothetical protein